MHCFVIAILANEKFVKFCILNYVSNQDVKILNSLRNNRYIDKMILKLIILITEWLLFSAKIHLVQGIDRTKK